MLVREAPRAQMLHEDVDRDLYTRVEVRVLHRLYRIVRRALLPAPSVMAHVLIAPRLILGGVEGVVEGIEEEVV